MDHDQAKGDTNFERCLLTSNFMEILPSGKLKTATDQLGFAAKKKDGTSLFQTSENYSLDAP